MVITKNIYEERMASLEERNELAINNKRFYKDYRFYLLSILTIGFIVLAAFPFRSSYIRLYHSFGDFGKSIGFYFCELFYIPHEIEPSVTTIDKLVDVPFIIFPINFEEFKDTISSWWVSLWSLESLTFYISDYLSLISNLCRWLLIFIPFGFLIVFFLKQYFNVNEDSIDDKDSKPLKIYKKTFFKFFNFLKKVFHETLAYFQEKKVFKYIWILIWFCSFNLITIIVEFLAFYFYFVLSFDIGNIFIQIYKLILDLRVIPWFVLLGGILYVIHKIRYRNAYDRLMHFELKNRGFLNSLGLVVLITGVTGKGKTLLMTDLALSQEVMFRDTAFSKIMNNDVKFPNFPFSSFESELKRAIYYHEVYTLATCETWINTKRRRFEKHTSEEKIFGYKYYDYGLYHDDGLKEEYIFDMLENYAKLYFLYTIESSLLISNYGIRVDNLLESANHFPFWNSDFFKDSKISKQLSRHSHIIDFDLLRLGKKVDEDNPISDSVEFGIYVITEFDKERGNQLTNQSFKVDSETANPKNDLTELCEKIYRHSATIDNYPFLRIFTDSQRAMSVMADNREIAEKIVNITDVGDDKNALSFFFIDEIIHDFFIRKLEKWYYKYRFARSDNTLFMYLFHRLCAYFIDRYNKKVNMFGYAVYSGTTEKSTMDGVSSDFQWYRLNKKIYSNRYKSNCFKDYWTEKALRSSIGLDDLREYNSTQASIGELKMQHSYWIDKLNDVLDKK